MRVVFDCWIESIDDANRKFTAIMINRGNKKYMADFSFDEVMEEERHCIEVGHLFLWYITEEESIITMNQSPMWTDEEMDAIKKRASELYKKLRFS